MSASFPVEEHPRLRPIEVFPIDDRGQRCLVLRDPGDSELQPIALTDGAAQVLMLLDGQRTVEAIAAALQLRGVPANAEQVRAFVERLDEGGFLEGPRAEHRLEQRRAAFRARPLRLAVHAGGAYPDGLDRLPRMLADAYVHPDGPGSVPAPRDPTSAVPAPRGVVAPHVDLHRGAPTYSWAYKAVAEAEPAELYLVLGTCHTPMAGAFAATNKAYDTPLGHVPGDAAFVDQLQRAWGSDLFAGEFSHASEHSIEFQAVYLRSLGIQAPMVPILCDSLHSLVPSADTSPREVALVSEFLEALVETMRNDGRSITVIAAVDLAHIGRRFGDAWLVDESRLAEVERADLEMLELALAPDAEAFFAHVMRDRDARRICGFTPIYLLSALMQHEDRHGDLLRYHQWVDTDRSSSVTFASAVYH